MFDAAIVFAGCLRPSIYDQVTAHTLPCLSKRRDLCSMIDFIKKRITREFPRFAFDTEFQIDLVQID